MTILVRLEKNSNFGLVRKDEGKVGINKSDLNPTDLDGVSESGV